MIKKVKDVRFNEAITFYRGERMEDVGRMLKELRKSKGYSIRKVADETGFSLSFLSKLENGKTSITIRNLVKLLSFYNVTLADIFSGTQNKKVTFKVDERKVLQSSESITLEVLVEDKSAAMEPLIATFQPRARYTETLEHGGEEFAMVIKGELRFELEDVSYHLREGDCAYFPGTKTHGWENLTDDTATLLMVTSPPSI